MKICMLVVATSRLGPCLLAGLPAESWRQTPHPPNRRPAARRPSCLEPEGFVQRIHEPVAQPKEGDLPTSVTPRQPHRVVNPLPGHGDVEFCGPSSRNAMPTWIMKAIVPGVERSVGADISFSSDKWHLYCAQSSTLWHARARPSVSPRTRRFDPSNDPRRNGCRQGCGHRVHRRRGRWNAVSASLKIARRRRRRGRGWPSAPAGAGSNR